MEEPIYQQQMLEFIKRYPNNGNLMIQVHGRTGEYGTDAYFQCRLCPCDSAEKDMETDDTNHWNGVSPGFTEFYGVEPEVVFSRFNNGYGMEPFVILRDFMGLKPEEVEIVEEFRLLNNLYYDRSKSAYIDLETDTEVVQIVGDRVYVHRKFLKRYLAVKNMVMLVHIDSRYRLGKIDPHLKPDSFSEKTDEKFYTFHLGEMHDLHKQNFSMIYAKTIIKGVPISECGYWPYDKDDKKFEDFTIGVDDDGDEITYTCNPSRLQNYFGANPDAPFYLTPVFFKREVLKRFYDSPEKYTVEAGLIRCGTWWSLYVDNEGSEYVSAYLGDLGHLSYAEQQQWRAYNISIDGKLSRSKFLRDFASIPTSSDSLIFIFQRKYESLNKLYIERFGWPLFLPLHDDDKYTLTGLRVPLLNSQPEFDQQILSLVKVLIDSLNEKEIASRLTDVPENMRGIGKLEKWLETSGVTNYTDIVKFLRNLQELRSSSTAHKKGKNYEKMAAVFNIGSERYGEAFIAIMESAIEFLNLMYNNIEKLLGDNNTKRGAKA